MARNSEIVTELRNMRSDMNTRLDSMNGRIDALHSRIDTVIDAIADLRSDLGRHTHDN